MTGMLIDLENGDLKIGAGGIEIGDSEAQTAEVVVMTLRGELKEHPLLGGEAMMLRGGVRDAMWGNRVRRMLRGCGVACERVVFGDGGEIVVK